MQHVVARVALQHRRFAFDAEHVAERMLAPRQFADAFAVGDDLGRLQRRDGDAVGIRQRGQQLLRQRQLRQQVGLAHRMLGRRQQGDRQQVDRIDVGRAIDVDLDALRQIVHRVADPGRFVVGILQAFAPVRRMHGQHVVERDRLAEVDRDPSVVRTQDLEHAADQRPDRFLLLGLAGEFVEVALALDQFLVADVHRLEHHRTLGRTQEGAQRHRDHAALRRQQAAGARATAFDEVFDREALAEQLRHVFGKHRRVQRIGLEAAPQEESAAAAQHRADHRQVQIDAGGDVRRHDAVLVEQVTQQQVIHVAAMAGHIDDLVAGRHLLELVQVMDADAVVDAVPETGQGERQGAHHRIGIVGGDFPGEAVRLLPGFQVFALVASRLFGDGLAHRLGVEHAVHQQAPRRQVGADDGGADLAEMRPQQARHLAHGAFVRQVFAEDVAHAHARRELHAGIAAVEQDRQQAPEAADDDPVFREQHREPA